jgi:hypothetical protein
MNDLTEAHPLIRAELNVKTLDGEHVFSGLVDYVGTLDFVSKDFLKRLSLPTLKTKSKTLARLANGQRVTHSKASNYYRNG